MASFCRQISWPNGRETNSRDDSKRLISSSGRRSSNRFPVRFRAGAFAIRRSAYVDEGSRVLPRGANYHTKRLAKRVPLCHLADGGGKISYACTTRIVASALTHQSPFWGQTR